MINWMIRRFVPHSGQTDDQTVRRAYGTLGTVTGVLVNALLAAAKLAAGLLSGSVSALADAANNLSDAAGSGLALVSVRLSQKPVDTEHPFGHGRFEYVGALGVSALVLVMGIELLISGVESVITPKALEFSVLSLGILAGSVGAKVFLFFLLRRLGRAARQDSLLAAAKDSLSDCAATGAVIVSMLVTKLFGVVIDGYVGVLVSLLVLRMGVGMIKEMISKLLGSAPDPDMIRRIEQALMAYDGIRGVHDIVLHDYGPGRVMASAHAEVDARADILAVHEIVDRAENEISRTLHIPICIHMDPIVTDDPTLTRVSEALGAFLKEREPRASMHDLRLVPGEKQINLIFDIVVPPEYKETDALLERVRAYAVTLDARYRCVIRLDQGYIGS